MSEAADRIYEHMKKIDIDKLAHRIIRHINKIKNDNERGFALAALMKQLLVGVSLYPITKIGISEDLVLTFHANLMEDRETKNIIAAALPWKGTNTESEAS